MSGGTPRVVTYRDTWLPASEGFVVEPTLHFTRYEASLVGLGHARDRHWLVDPSDVQVLGRVNTVADLCRVRASGLGSEELPAVLGSGVRLVHAHFGPDALVGEHVARALHVPLVVTMHGYDVTTRDRDFLRSRLGRSYLRGRARLKRRASVVIAVSDYLRQQMLAKGWPAERVVTNHIGVDTEYWAPAVGARRTDVLFVGRLVPLKGAHLAAGAFERVADEFPDSRLHVVGDGPDHEALAQIAGRQGGRVVLHGSLPRVRIRELMATSAVALLPSGVHRGRREALNLAALESAASGVPVVAFESGGVPEVVKHGVTGLLAPEGDVDALVRHLRAVLRSEVSDELGAGGRSLAVERFAMPKQAATLEGIYDDVLSRAMT